MPKDKRIAPKAEEKGKKKARQEEEEQVEEAPAVEEVVEEAAVEEAPAPKPKKEKKDKKKKETPPPPPKEEEEEEEEEEKPAPAPVPEEKEEEEEEKPAEEEAPEEEKPAPAEGESLSAFVANISFDATEDDLRQFFADCGEITALEFNRGKAVVTFATPEALKKALELSEQELCGRNVYVNVNKPGKSLSGPKAEPSATLFMGNLSFNATEDSISEAFAECGNIKSVRLITDRETGKFKGFGYIEFESEDAAKAAMEMNGTEIDGRAVRLDFAQARQGGGDRGGRGGFGGRGRGGRGGFGDRGGRGGFGGRGGRGGFRGGRGGFGDRGGRGGRGGFRGGRGGRGGMMRAGSAPGEYGKKTTFGDE